MESTAQASTAMICPYCGADIQHVPRNFAPEKRTYWRAPLDESYRIRPNDFYTAQGLVFIKAQIERIVKAEGPITEKLLFKRVIEEWGLTSKSKRELMIFQKAIPKNIPVTQHIGGTVYWPANYNPLAWNIYRVPDDTPHSPIRSFDEIPLEEIHAATIAVRMEINVIDNPSKNVPVSTLKRFGLKSFVTPEMAPILEAAIHGQESSEWHLLKERP